MKPQLPIVRPHHPAALRLLSTFAAALDAGHVTNNGAYVQRFEAELSRLLDIPTIVFTSGMAALIAMLRAVDVEGGEVVCPSFTFAATPHAVVLAGATPVFADIDAETLTMNNLELLTKYPNLNTKAVLGVDPYGICWKPPRELVDDGVPVLIDAAPSFGSEVGDDSPVRRGLAQVFSFHATKPFSTMEGGALCSFDADLIKRAKAIRNFGQNPDGDCDLVGFNGKMLEICAITGLEQLDDWQDRAARRVESAIRLRRALRELDIPGFRVQHPPLGQSPIWTYQPVFIEEEFGLSRDDVMRELAKRGIQTRAYYRACHLLRCYLDDRISLPVTERLAAQVIALPVYDRMTGGEIGTIAAAFREIRQNG